MQCLDGTRRDVGWERRAVDRVGYEAARDAGVQRIPVDRRVERLFVAALAQMAQHGDGGHHRLRLGELDALQMPAQRLEARPRLAQYGEPRPVRESACRGP